VLRNLEGYVFVTFVSSANFALRKPFFFWNMFVKGLLTLTPLPSRRTTEQTYWHAPKSRGETHLMVSQSQVAES
jgi:hypothetical protein